MARHLSVNHEDQPIDENANFGFTADGDLVLEDQQGQRLWSTNSGRSVRSMNLTCRGNPILVDVKSPNALSSVLLQRNMVLTTLRMIDLSA